MAQEELAIKAGLLRIAIQGLRMDASDDGSVNPDDVDAVECLALEIERALRRLEAAAVKAA
jgi:hypothetical protein